MATSNSSSPSAEQSVGMSPRPGRKLRLSADEGERLRSASPHSPRKPRTSKSLSRSISVDSISSGPVRSLGSFEDASHIKGTFASLQRSVLQPMTKNSQPGTTPEIMPLSNSKPDRPVIKPAAFCSRSMKSPEPPRSPRLRKTVSWSTEFEEDSPRSTKPLRPLSSSPKKESPISSNTVSETNNKLIDLDEETPQPSPKTSPRSILGKGSSLETEPGSPQSERGKSEKGSCKKHSSPKTPNWLLETEPSFNFAGDYDSLFLPERALLPDTSSIFQQALTNLKSRKPSLSSDPGDLHVRRSSLVTSFLDFTEGNSSTTRLSYSGIDCVFDTCMLSTVSEKYDNPTDKEPRLPKSMLPKEVSNWIGRPRKISAPSKMVTVDQAPLSPLTPTPPRRRGVSEIQPPRRELLEVTDNPRPKKTSDSMSESSEGTSRSSQNYVTEISRPLISGRAMNYVMKFISYSTASDAAPGRHIKPSRLPTKENPKFPSIQNSGSAWRATNRRDSIRAIQHIINEGNTLGDTTEITSFDDLRNCRYIRDFKPTGKEARAAKHTKYHEW